ncbi:MAG: hypothetical protein WCB85_14165 [Candidatus Dormiibacterota bacterium]
MTPLEIVLCLVELCIAIAMGYDAERWDQSVNLWSLAGLVLSVVGLGLWLYVRHAEAERRRAAGLALPTPMLRWLGLRRRLRRMGAGRQLD